MHPEEYPPQKDFEQISYLFHTLYLGYVLYMSQINYVGVICSAQINRYNIILFPYVQLVTFSCLLSLKMQV